MKISPYTIVYQPDAGGGGGSSSSSSSSRKASKSSSKTSARASKASSKGGSKASSKSSKSGRGSKAASKTRGGGGPPSSKASGGAKGPQKKRASANEKNWSTAQIKTIKESAPDLVKSLNSIDPNLSSMLVASSFPTESLGADEGQAIQSLRTVIGDLQRSKDVITVALWDLGARIGLLPEIIDLLNQSQPVFTFFNLQAPVPAGLVIQAENFAAWARHHSKEKVKTKGNQVIHNNLMSNDFYKYAQTVYKNLGVKYLVGVTPYMVAGEEHGKLFWNYFSTSRKGIILASSYELREYAQQAGRPFEVAVAGVVIAQLLVEINKGLKFHDENRGCMFDFNNDRVSIVESIRNGMIEPACLNLIDEKYRQAAQNMMAALKSYSREEEAPPGKNGPQGTDYWRKKLHALTSQLNKTR